MSKLSAEAKKQIMNWIDKLEDGDTILFMNWIDKLEDGDTILVKGGAAFIYNSSGCEIDSTL